MSAFPLLGEPLALDLANTLVREHRAVRDLLTEPGGAQAWLAAQRDRLPGPEPASGELVALRDAIVELMRAADERRTPDRAAAAAVTAALEGAAPEVAAGPDGPQVRWRSSEAAAGASVLAAIAHSAVALLAPGHAGVRRCENADCLLHFAAGDPRRRFCVARICGNRTRQARHRERRRTGT